MSRPKTRRDLTGMRFRKLVVIGVDEERTKDNKVYWICKCDCGNITSVQSTSLTRKNGTKSCGCARNSKEAKIKAKITSNSYPKNIKGLKFGRLTVVEKTDMKSDRAADNGAYLWKCKCDCGGVCYYSRYSLITPNGIKSCGCLYDDSRFIIAKNYCTYDLDTYDFGIGYCQNGTYFFFDKEDYDKIKEYSWWYDGRYVIAHSLKNDKYTTDIIRLHRVVMDIGDREKINVDHKNLIRYDCRKINLRRATDSQNAMNKNYLASSSTGVVGVNKQKDKWSASITKNGKIFYLGTFEKFEDAVKARQQAELEIFKEFRYCLEEKDIIDESNMEKYKIFKNVG